MGAIARRRVGRVDPVNGVRFQRRRTEPSPRLGRDDQEAREGEFVDSRSRRGRGGERRGVGCLRATRAVARSGHRGQERAVHAGLADVALVSDVSDVAAAACRRDFGHRQRDDDHQQGQSAPGDSIHHARPREQHDSDSGVGRRGSLTLFYPRYARVASKVRSRIVFRPRIPSSQPARDLLSLSRGAV